MYNRDAPFRSEPGDNVNINDLYGDPFDAMVKKSRSGNWSQHDQDVFEFFYGIGFTRDYLDYLYDRAERQDTFDLYGIEWKNVRDPRNVQGARSSARMYGSVVNFVSDNIKRLYN